MRQKYKWAYRKKTTSIPVGKVFLKRKKQWKSGRTIITYHKVVRRLLFKAVAILLGEIAADTWRRSWGIHPTPRIWQNIKQYFDNTDDTVTLAFHNDDLVGFFNSVPQDQVCAAVAQLLAEHQRDRPSSVYSVETQATAHHNRVFAGKQSYGRTPTTRIIHVEDIMTIVKSSFQGMYVPVGTLIMRQVHGTAIGSQLSPVLSHICVARHEVMWQRIYGQWYTSHNVFLERYVDNRFVIFPSPSSGHPAPPLEGLLQADFYGAPIVLEQVGSSRLRHRCRLWQIRGPRTAGSLSVLLSGARSRSALATKYAHPARAVQMALDQLRSIYLSAGYKSADLQHLFHLPATPTRKNSQAPAFWLLSSCARVCLFLFFLVSCFLMSVLTMVLIHWFKQCCTSCRPPPPVAMLGRMIALHHRMTQNAGDMMLLIQETLNQADEARSRRHHDGQGRCFSHLPYMYSTVMNCRSARFDPLLTSEIVAPHLTAMVFNCSTVSDASSCLTRSR